MYLGAGTRFSGKAGSRPQTPALRQKLYCNMEFFEFNMSNA